jgi:GDPmannose 4,6-dehydratase
LDYREYVETDPACLRPAEIYHLRGDYTKAARELGWKPTVAFQELIKMMVNADMARVQRARANTSAGETAP